MKRVWSEPVVASNEPVVLHARPRTSSFSSSLSVSCSWSLDGSSGVVSPSFSCVPLSRSSSRANRFRVLAPICWLSTSFFCFCVRISIFLSIIRGTVIKVLRHESAIVSPKYSLSNHEPRAFVDFGKYESPGRRHPYPHAPDDLKIAHTFRLQFICIFALRSVQGERFTMLLPKGSGFDCGTDCGTGACVSVPQDVLGSGWFTFFSLSFIFPSLTAVILSNQWVFWITAGSDRCGANK